ncbi:DUF4376 domain-containing protein, partial [Salmonella enterica]
MFTFSNEPQVLSVFNFSSDTNEYIGESDAYIAPNTGLPGNCTQVQPPEIKPGFTPVWLGEEWQLVEDHRGQIVYDKESGHQVNITELGGLFENVTIISPMSKFDRWNGETWQPSITDAKAAKIQQIKAHRDDVTADYIVIDGNHFHSDANSRIQQMSLTRMGQAK